MTVDLLFTMRGRVVRSVVDPNGQRVYGQLPRVDQVVHAALPCYVWTERTREVVDENRTAGIVDFRLICAKQTDLQSDDRVTLTTENEELRVMGSPVVRLDHLDAALERVT